MNEQSMTEKRLAITMLIERGYSVDEAYLKVSLKNGDLVVQGAKVLDSQFIDAGTDAPAMTFWEMDCYSAYDALHGEGACEKAGINTLEDLFGKDFSDEFFRIKNRRIARIYLPEAQQMLLRAKHWIDGLEATIDNPTECEEIKNKVVLSAEKEEY